MASLLKVSAKSNPNAVAGAIAGIVRQSGSVELQVIGAGALNQAIKAIAIARGFVIAGGIDLVCIPSFQDVKIDGDERTAIRMRIEDRVPSRTMTELVVEQSDLRITPAPTDLPQ